MHPLDLYRAAKLLIDQHGNDALSHAARRMMDMKQVGDVDGEALWGRVFQAIQNLQMTKPDRGTAVH